MTHLVTGAAGLVGKKIVEQLLAEGKKVRALINTTPLDITHPNLEIINCDILDIENLRYAFESVDKIYHTAAIVSYSPHNRLQMYKTNVEGTANVVNLANELKIKKLLYISSVAAIEPGPNPLNESKFWKAETKSSHYARSKYMAEMQVWRAAAEGLNMVIVNPSVILGFGNWNSGSCQIFKTIFNKFPYYSNGKTGFVCVEDVAALCIKLMESDISDERFILNENNYTFKEIFDLIAKGFGVPPPQKLITPTLAALAWRIEKIKFWITGKAPLVTKETAKNALEIVEYDNTKIKNTFKDFNFTPIVKGIEEYCKKYIEHYKK